MTGCSSESLRLYKRENENEGNLQICTNGTWLQVISYNWDSLEGEVACRQLGLLHSGGTSKLIMKVSQQECTYTDMYNYKKFDIL